MAERVDEKGNAVDEAVDETATETDVAEEVTETETAEESQDDLELDDDTTQAPAEGSEKDQGDEDGEGDEEDQPKGEVESPPEDKEVEQDPVPQAILRHRPELADMWNQLTPEQRKSIQDGVIDGLEQEPEPEGTGEQEVESSLPSETPTAPEQPTQVPTAQFDYTNQPVDVTPEQIEAFIEDVGASPESGQLLQQLCDMAKFSLGVTQDWGNRAMAEVERTSKTTVTLIQEKAFDAALDKHADEMAGLSVVEYTAVAKAASEAFKSGRVPDAMDAVSLAIHRANKGEPGEATSRSNRRRQAASVRGSTRRGPKELGPPPISGTFAENAAWAAKKVALDNA